MVCDCARTLVVATLRGGGAGVRRPQPREWTLALPEFPRSLSRHRRGRLGRAVSPWCRLRARGEFARRVRSCLLPKARRLFATGRDRSNRCAKSSPTFARKPSWSISIALSAETMCSVGSRSRSCAKPGTRQGRRVAATTRGPPQAHGDLFAKLIDPKTPLDHEDLARVAGDAWGFEIEDRAVLWAQGNRAGFHA